MVISSMNTLIGWSPLEILTLTLVVIWVLCQKMHLTIYDLRSGDEFHVLG
jgi:hypothetical protein